MSKCSTCNADIRWAVTPKGKPIPIDVDPREDGNLWLEERQEGSGADALPANPLARSVDMLTPEDELRYVSHFATCPEADAHRRQS